MLNLFQAPQHALSFLAKRSTEKTFPSLEVGRSGSSGIYSGGLRVSRDKARTDVMSLAQEISSHELNVPAIYVRVALNGGRWQVTRQHRWDTKALRGKRRNIRSVSRITVLDSAAVPGPSMGGTLSATGGPLRGAVQWRYPAERVYGPDQPAKFTPDLLRRTTMVQPYLRHSAADMPSASVERGCRRAASK